MGACIKGSKKKKSDEKLIFRPVKQEDDFSGEQEIIALDESVESFSHYPEFYTTVGLSGVWIYTTGEDDIQFSEEIQQEIESSFIAGKASCEVIIDGVQCLINFKEQIMQSDQSTYPINRSKLRKELYGWQADDKTISLAIMLEDIYQDN